MRKRNMKTNRAFYCCLLILISILTLGSCERDDICSLNTETTPKLILRFYDIANPDSFKNVPRFRVQGVDNTNVLADYTGNTARDSIVLPLKTNATTTQYKLHRNYSYDDNDTPDDTSDDSIGGNEDIITISYTTETVYVSRACGYKTVYKEVEITLENDADNWITFIQPVNETQSVVDETAAHFKIWH